MIVRCAGMKWQRKRDNSKPDNSTASAADHVQSYWEYNRLVGESAGDRLLSEVLPTNPPLSLQRSCAAGRVH